VRNCLTTSLKVNAFLPKGALINCFHGKIEPSFYAISAIMRIADY
jgi:hypothetical protein